MSDEYSGPTENSIDPAAKQGVSAEDKLRLIADTVDGQQPFGTELANFRRRLNHILEL